MNFFKKIGTTAKAIKNIAAPKTEIAKKFAVVLTLALAAILFIPHNAHADLFGIGDVAAGVVGWIAFSINYILATVAGVLIALITYFIGVLLTLNTQIVNAFAVQTGFSITLSVANLGFILGIIVIAIATIIRSQSYGMKQILWKLVVAAVLVNFSLVICGPIIGFADQLTSYFMTAVPGGGGGVTGFFNFASALAGAFSPQRALLGLSANGNDLSGNIAGTSVNAGSGSSLANILTPLVSIGFVVAFLIVITITLAVFLFQLVVRYITLGILLILMPIVWLAWVFPQFSSHWSKWWSEFLRWTFFAPTVMFFLWLAIITASAMNTTGAQGATSPLAVLNGSAYQSGGPNPITQGTASSFPFVTQMAGTIMQMIIVLGLMIGGMIAADKLSITGSKTAISAAKSSGNYIKGQAKKGGRLAYQKTDKQIEKRTGAGITQRLQEGRVGVLKFVPGAKRGASLLGRGIQSSATNEEMVKEAAKKVPHDTEAVERNLRGSMNAQDQLAHIAHLVKEGKLKNDTMVGNKTVAEFMDDNQDLVKRYGQGKLAKDVNKTVGSSKEMREADKRLSQARTDEEKVIRSKELEEASKKFVEDLDGADARKINVNDVFKDPASLMAKAFSRNVALFNPTLVPAMMPKMQGKTKKSFKTTYGKELKGLTTPLRKEIEIRHGTSLDAVRGDIETKKIEIEDQEGVVSGLKSLGDDTEEGKKKLASAREKLSDLEKQRERLSTKLKDAKKKIDDTFKAENENLALAEKGFEKSFENQASGSSTSAEESAASAPAEE